jgi:pimeloyl-ACP methyl ester carboxylesterase
MPIYATGLGTQGERRTWHYVAHVQGDAQGAACAGRAAGATRVAAQLHVHNAIPPGGGFEEATPLICLHGTQGSGRLFKGFLALFGRDRSVYAPDLPGYGESDGPPQSMSAAEYAAAVGDFLDTMRLRHVDLLAHGAGSVLATELASTRGPQVRRVVLVSVPLGTASLQGGGAPAGGLGAAAAGYALRERLGRVSQPLLVLRPRDEWWDATARVREVQPAARVLDLPDSGPDLFQSAPGVVAEAVGAFLRG